MIRVERLTEPTTEALDAFARLMPQLSTSARPLDADALRAIVESPCNNVLIARDPQAGDAIVGALTLVTFRIPTGIRAWIEDVVVDDTARGRGVGEALTRAAIAAATTAGAKTVDLTSRRSREAAHRLYEKCGFAVRDTSVYRITLPKS